MWFQVFLSLWSVTSCSCIDKIPKVAKTKVSNPRDILYLLFNSYRVKTRPRPPKTPHSNMSKSLCGEICITPPKRIRNERRRSYYSVCSVVAAAGVMFWRRCVSLWKRNYFVWDPNEDTTRNQWFSCIHNTVTEQFNTNIGVCAAHFT